MAEVLIIAPHPDDETLGCGGTLLRHKQRGDGIHWVIATAMAPGTEYSAQRMQGRKNEIEEVRKAFGFSSMHTLNLPAARLDTLPRAEVIGAIKTVWSEIGPDTVYLPHPGDAHSDHRVTFDAAAACAKWFRAGTMARLLIYETLSETEFAMDPDRPEFRPNVFVNISGFLQRKLEIMSLYAGEMGEFPFPRSVEAIRAQAQLRGTQCGFEAAEAFMLVQEAHA